MLTSFSHFLPKTHTKLRTSTDSDQRLWNWNTFASQSYALSDDLEGILLAIQLSRL